MSQIRKAHSVEVIDRRLRDYQPGDLMELVSLYDELARVDRKWRERAAAPPRTGPRARPLADADALDARFRRLANLIEAALLRPGPDSPERALLTKAADALRQRVPLKPPETGAS